MERREVRTIVIIPALNEEETIGEVIQGCHEALRGGTYEILVVDGHSSDDTVDIASREGATVIVQTGSGYGDALMCGFRHALRVYKADIVVMMDADGTYPPLSIVDLLEPLLHERADFVIGDRFANLEKEAMPLVNRIGNRLFSALSRFLFKIPSLDTQSGFRAFRAQMLNHILFKNPGMPLASEMIVEAKNANYRITQVPITYRPRKGKSKLRPMRDAYLILGTMIRLYRDYSPLFFFGAIGGFFLAIGGFLGLYLLIGSLVIGLAPSMVLTLTSSVMLLSGLLIVAIGLLADMIKDLRERLRMFEIQLMENFSYDKSSEMARSKKKEEE